VAACSFVAGFDACFRYRERDAPLVEALLAASRRRARTLRLRQFRSWIATIDCVAAVQLDGNTYLLDIYLERLRRDLPTIAEATPSPRTPAERRKVANGFLEILVRHRGQMYDRYDEAWVPTLRARSTPQYMLPHEFFTKNAKLQTRLLATSEFITGWHFGDVEPAIVVEELHTAAELMLSEIVGKRSSTMSFAQMTEACQAAGALQRRHADVLTSLKDVRKRVRHRADPGAKTWLDCNFWDAAGALEHLAVAVPETPSP
jgi:hypothetical protein